MASGAQPLLTGLVGLIIASLVISCVTAGSFHKFRGQLGRSDENETPEAAAQAARLLGPPADWDNMCLWQMRPCNPWNDKCCPGMRCLNYAQGYCLKGLEPCACFPVGQPVDNQELKKLKLKEE